MFSINKNITPWFLVASSIAVLLIFLGYWNVSTYLTEKKKLAEDVEIQLQLAFTEIKDSELIYFIRTRLSDDEEGRDWVDSISVFLEGGPVIPSAKNGFQDMIARELSQSTHNRDTNIILDIAIDTNRFSKSNNILNRREVTVIASSEVDPKLRTDIEEDNQDSSNFDFQIKRFDIQGSQTGTMGEFRLHSDTGYFSSWMHVKDSFPERLTEVGQDEGDSLFNPLKFFDSKLDGKKTSVDKTYNLFKVKLIENKLPHDFAIISRPSQKIEGMKVTYESNGFGFTEWSIDLKKYLPYILQNMIPTLLFSFFLLGIISLAFWTLLTNWIKQNRLVVVKNEFINNMTHELKTPIATVGVALEAISNFDLSTEQAKTKEYIDISRKEINRLSLLVDKVLNIAAFDSKNTTLKSESVDIIATIEDTIQSMKLQIEDKNARIDFQHNISNSIVIGDKLHLGNVVHNIIDNALKYSTTDAKIDISISENTENFTLLFSDNGQGIPKEYQSKIFDRFFRVPSEDLHDVKGHGLGLNYVQNIVQAHGGKISVESDENQGTTFTISLPKSASDV